MRLFTQILLCVLLFNPCFGEEVKYQSSEPINIPLVGWNKVLLMKNGNTLLFHFEPRKGIIVKVFDKDHKEIASKKHVCDVLDINALDRSFFDGAIAVNDEALLFITQTVDNKETLLRLRINGNTGGLISEDKLIQSASFQHKTIASLLKNGKSNNYHFVSYQSKAGFPEKPLTFTSFNEKQEKVLDIPININQKGYDEVNMRGVSIDDNNGIIVAVELTKIVQYPNLMDRTLVIGYKPESETGFILKEMKLPVAFDDFSFKATYNPYAKSLNILLSNYVNGYVENGLRKEKASLTYQTLVVMNDDLSSAMSVALNNNKIREFVKTTLDSTYDYSGDVLKMHTNNYGLSTVLYQGKIQEKKVLGRDNMYGLKRNISITQFNDKGEEIWGTALPKSRLFTSNNYPTVFKKASETELCGLFTACTKNNNYIVFNELNNNFDLTLPNTSDSVYNCEFSNGMYYRVSRKREVTKGYLFGKPGEGEYKQLYSGSGDFDETNYTYVTLYLDKKDQEIKTRLAWFQLEP